MGKSLLNPIILCVTLLNNLSGREKTLRPHTWLKGRVCGRNACDIIYVYIKIGVN